MSSTLLVALILVALLVAVGWHHFARRRGGHRSFPLHGAPRNAYHCVEVRPRGDPCEAAKQLGRTRFLSDEAPRLPLPGCTAQPCSCRYLHHADRRQEDRRNPYGQAVSEAPAGVGAERRGATDRRKAAERPFRTRLGR